MVSDIRRIVDDIRGILVEVYCDGLVSAVVKDYAFESHYLEGVDMCIDYFDVFRRDNDVEGISVKVKEEGKGVEEQEALGDTSAHREF